MSHNVGKKNWAQGALYLFIVIWSPYVDNPVKACLVTFPGSANLTTSPNSHLQDNVPVIDVAIFYDNNILIYLVR
jgi:hypothetical protein